MFSVERKDYTAISTLTLSLINDLAANGFTVKYPVDENNVYVQPADNAAFKVILETTSAVSNIFHTSQAWRICFEIISNPWPLRNYPPLGGPFLLACHVGTANNLKDDGTVSRSQALTLQGNYATMFKNEPFGNIGGQWNNTGDGEIDLDAAPAYSDKAQCFYNRFLIENNNMGGYRPLSYRTSITSRGLFIGIWDSLTQETGTGFNWLLVQRSVDSTTGAIRGTTPSTIESKCPVFCVNSTNNQIYKFIAREADVPAPSTRIENKLDAEDSAAPLNTFNQVSFNEDGNYVISLLNNLTTPRFKYPDELDMVGTISADVIGASQKIDITVYGEAQPRKYVALQANGANNTGMRLMVLVENANE
jgi:hypothetical protein